MSSRHVGSALTGMLVTAWLSASVQGHEPVGQPSDLTSRADAAGVQRRDHVDGSHNRVAAPTPPPPPCEADDEWRPRLVAPARDAERGRPIAPPLVGDESTADRVGTASRGRCEHVVLEGATRHLLVSRPGLPPRQAFRIVPPPDREFAVNVGALATSGSETSMTTIGGSYAISLDREAALEGGLDLGLLGGRPEAIATARLIARNVKPFEPETFVSLGVLYAAGGSAKRPRGSGATVGGGGVIRVTSQIGLRGEFQLLIFPRDRAHMGGLGLRMIAGVLVGRH
jgi:hypothetical protein